MAREMRTVLRSIAFQIKNAEKLNEAAMMNEAICEEWLAYAKENK